MPDTRLKQTSKVGVNPVSLRLQAAAKLIGSPVERFIAWKDLPDGSLVVIDYDGRKYQFSLAELE
jgi:hypothetical protein